MKLNPICEISPYEAKPYMRNQSVCSGVRCNVDVVTPEQLPPKVENSVVYVRG